MIKPILNGSELSIYNQIKAAIKEKSINVFSQQNVKLVIDCTNLNLSGKERDTYNNAIFDFVITDENSIALFVIEFDGPDHKREKNQLADYRKVLICKKANLPIIRINYDLFDSFSKDAIIEFIIYRYLKWIDEKELFTDEFNELIIRLQKRGKTADEIIEYVSGQDPETEFNYKYYFPGIYLIEKCLYLDHNLYPDYFEIYPDRQFKSKYIQVKGFSYDIVNGKAISIVSFKIKAIIEKNGIESIFEKEFDDEQVSIQWVYNCSEIVKNNNGPSKDNYYQSYFNAIPGLSITDFSLMLAKYKALKHILAEAQRIKNDGFKFVNSTAEDIASYYKESST